MAKRERLTKRDGFLNLNGGVDTNLNPNLLSRAQLAGAVNVTLRGGYAENRPGFNERTMTFAHTEMQSWVEGHNVQGVGYYQPSLRDPFYIFSSGGRIFKLEVMNDYFVSEVTPSRTTNLTNGFVSPALGADVSIEVDDGTSVFVNYPIRLGSGFYLITARQGNILTAQNINTVPGLAVTAGMPVYYQDPNNPNTSRAWLVQAENYMVIQNGTASAIIFDGTVTRRATTNPPEIPPGRMMEYSQGRIWVAINDSEYVAGDIANGPTGVLGFEENNLLVSGGKFKIPEGSGRIVAMRTLQNLDTTLGQGPLQVVTENSIFSCNAPASRDLWRQVTDPIQTVSTSNGGGTSQYSVLPVNGDLFLRSRDGIRSFFMARREFGSWGNTPISLEMSEILNDDDPKLLKYSSAVLFDNRILFTNRPIPESTKYTAYHCGMVSLNMDPISGIRTKINPVWEGLWTGINPYILTTGNFGGEDRCFAFCRNPSTTSMELWEISKRDTFDNGSGRIQSSIESSALNFRDPFEMMRLDGAEIWIDRLIGVVDFVLTYRPDQYPCWFDWPNDKQECSKYKDCTQVLSDCKISPNYGAGFRTRLRWAQPPEQNEPFDQKPAHLFYECQIRLQWTGHARVKAGLLKAAVIQEEPHAGDL